MFRSLVKGLSAAFFATALASASAASPRVETFEFTEPAPKTYRLEVPVDAEGKPLAVEWLQVQAGSTTLSSQAFGARIVLSLQDGFDLTSLPLTNSAVAIERRAANDLWILRATDAHTAAGEAQRLARFPHVRLCHPDMRFERKTSSRYAPKPNDEKYLNLWHLEARDASGANIGADVNAREAWAVTRGEGILIAVGDDGMEVDHPDLVAATTGQPHFNFENSNSNVLHTQNHEHHGTSVGGLAAARGDNFIGMAGAAPQAGLAGWKMLFASSLSVFEMFQYQSNRVHVQNHSWSFGRKDQVEVPTIELRGITNAFLHGRNGKGVVLVRASGNNRTTNPGDIRTFPPIAMSGDANDDGYVHHVHSIAVAAVRLNGRVASYSTPGSCVLIAAGSGDTGFPNLFTTDRSGAKGRNAINCLDFTNCWDYIFDNNGFVGTSGSSPIVAGVAALVLGANTNLSVRDVQQILALSARHIDLADTDIQTNGAGLLISHNIGYGVADAGEAVRLAKLWTNRPPRQEFRYVAAVPSPVPIPDFGHVVRADGNGVPSSMNRLQGWFPDLSQHPDDDPGEWRPPNRETTAVPLTHVGIADQDLTQDLTGRAALIERGQVDFIDKLNRAKAAGAPFAIVYNRDKTSPTESHDPEELISMGLQSINTYPAIFIGRADGIALRDQSETNSNLRVQLVREGPRFTFTVTNKLICEHVVVRILTDHPRRQNLLINLYSPSGTRSRLTRSLHGQSVPNVVTFYTDAGPLDWNYHSVMHFFEPAAGEWTLQVVDEQEGEAGRVLGVELLVTGIPITDSDADGLDDAWETLHFGNLASGPRDDPDHDGYQNAKEQALGSNPAASDSPFSLTQDLSIWSDQLGRVSWPGSTNYAYSLEASDNAEGAFITLSNVPPRFPVTEVFLPHNTPANRFFRVRATAVTR